MSVTETIKNIYDGPFNQYLDISKQIGGLIYEQSKLVDVLFLLEINLIDITQRYKKPIHKQEENVFLEPINIEIGSIQKFRISNNWSQHVYHLSLISESTEVFEWIFKQDNKENISRFKNKIEPFISKTKSKISQLESIHWNWLESWNQCLEELSAFILHFYRNGLEWLGTEKLPEKMSLGDMSLVYKNTNHLKLFQEINQGENITRILRQTSNENIPGR